MFKVKSNLLELGSPHTQNTVEIVAIIFTVVDHECLLCADRFLTEKNFGHPHLLQLECSTHVDCFLGPQHFEAGGVLHSTFEQHHVRASGIDHQAQVLALEFCSQWSQPAFRLSNGAEKAIFSIAPNSISLVR